MCIRDRFIIDFNNMSNNGNNASRVFTTPQIGRLATTVAPTPKGDNDETPVGLIVGCVIGAIALFAILVICIFWRYKKQKQLNSSLRHPSPMNAADNELESGTFNSALDASVHGLSLKKIFFFF